MNLSGPPVARTLRGLALQPTHLVVLHDSLAHKTLAVSPKDGGSPNGHNGLRSIISALGTQSFHRIRLGIGKNEVDAAEYVMEKISPAERAFWGENGPGVEQAWKAVERLAVKLAQP
jgi:PTH1 family peptidyl-tRNA hydrolase